ncbi:MAG: hypothetical protein N2746_09565 [Deltaproteobacteria bacterium]|nr:hypothetical protein [Deltaproteobacteria bacterium]
MEEYCKGKGLKMLSEAIIGNMLSREETFSFRIQEGYVTILTANGLRRVRIAQKGESKIFSKYKELGHIVQWKGLQKGFKEYFYSAIDAIGNFALTLNYNIRD